MTGALDPRLTDFSFEERRAGYVEKIIDTHVHYTGNPKDLEMLAECSEVSRIESMFLLGGKENPKEWLKEVDAALGIGKKAIPHYYINMRSNDPDQVDFARDLGFWGLKVIGPAVPLDDLFFEPLLKRAEDLRMACLFHTGVLSGGKKNGSGMSLMRADMMDTIAKRHPELLIVGAHLGCPNIHEAFWGSEFNENLIWDCSGGCRFEIEANPLILHAAMHRRKRAWKSITFATDTTQGLYPPEWADGWPSKVDHRMAEWQQLLASLPVPPTSEELDNFFYNNARNRIDEIRKKRKELNCL